MSLHANRVQMTVSSVDGSTGELTLGSATTGYQSFNAAYGANATVDILIVEGTDWEVDRNCLYDDSGGTVTRGTFEDSSSGSSVTFTSAAIVSVIATAATGNNWGLNEVKAAVTGSNVTGVVGTMHILDLSGLTADRDFVLPATCAVGDRVGVMVEVGDADYELLLKPDGSDTINGGAAGAEWSRVFITGEVVIFRCVTANSAWMVEYDGRISGIVIVENNGSTQQSIAGSATAVKITTALTTVVKDDANQWDTTNKEFKPRRAGKYLIGGGVAISQMDNNATLILTLYKNGSDTRWLFRIYNGGGPGTSNMVSGIQLFDVTAATDAFALYVLQGSASAKNTEAVAARVFFNAIEVL